MNEERINEVLIKEKELVSRIEVLKERIRMSLIVTSRRLTKKSWNTPKVYLSSSVDVSYP